MDLSEIIKLRRKELNLTLKDIADKMGVAEATVQRYESGNIKNLRHNRIGKLAEVLDLDPAILMGWSRYISLENSTNFPDSEIAHTKLIGYFDELNTDGQERVLEYAEGLASGGKYKKGTVSAKNDGKGERVS